MGDDKSSSSILMARVERDRELLIPVSGSSVDDDASSKPSSSASSSHHSGREVTSLFHFSTSIHDLVY